MQKLDVNHYTALELKRLSSRAQFAALLNIGANEKPVCYLDGPGGTQVPRRVSRAILEAYDSGCSNVGGYFSDSAKAERIVCSARKAIASLINAGSHNSIVFGQNMTSLTRHMASSIAHSWKPGDEIVLSKADHAANRTIWEKEARRRDVRVRYIDVNVQTTELSLLSIDEVICEKTVFIAVTAASNVTGTISPLEKVVASAEAVNAQTFIDAVHLLPHQMVDVQALGIDYLVGSAYKFFGPHVGFLYGKPERLATLFPFKVTPAPGSIPRRFETGTANFSALVGVYEAVQYIKSLSLTPAPTLAEGYGAIAKLERVLSSEFVDAISQVKGVNIVGVNEASSAYRTSTFAVTIDGHDPEQVATYLGGHGVYVWSGHLYADMLIDALGLTDAGGIVRIGFMHYNTPEEVHRVCELLERFVFHPAINVINS